MKYLKKLPKKSSNKSSAPEPMEVDSSPSVSAPPCIPAPCIPGTSTGGITGRDTRQEESMEVVPEMIDVNEKMECEHAVRGKKRKCKEADKDCPPLKRKRKERGTKRKSRWHDGALRKRVKLTYSA
ncbi:uncharacterized protein LOC132755226 isoform X2 [Ruditapes philippinarum]|uniref:uncharacterized protein LOC132755226 isoform X2 n=1 Tax=Ruditapes philippinarum TaxID=129788 RepID=UPI00295A7492|nr:uncharacterized protein LOC132755226 isoform X2 [Ruditapes philippinarum]